MLSLAKLIGCSETATRTRVRSMHDKGCIVIEQRTKNGHLIRVLLPAEIDGAVPRPGGAPVIDVAAIDFFSERKHLCALFARENGRCFYCLREIAPETCALDHVVPQVSGTDHSYRNVVASCHGCNALKQGDGADDFLRSLYRRGVLSQDELQDRLGALERLRAGQLVPEV